jgi:FKBP-type peptidyl-prolyl cis-trans isomerase
VKFFQKNSAIFLLLLTACGAPREQAPLRVEPQSKDKQILQDVNKYLSEKEQDILAAYVARQQLDMQQSPSGYYYQIVEQGGGVAVADGDAVRLFGRIFLLNGAPCYSYTEQHPLDVMVGTHAEIKILNTALLGMKEGSRVRFVFPAHMAFSLLGDGNKIPPRSSLVCDFVVAKVAKK